MSAQAVTLREEVGKFKLDTYSRKDGLSSISLLKEHKAGKQSGAYAASSLEKY